MKPLLITPLLIAALVSACTVSPERQAYLDHIQKNKQLCIATGSTAACNIYQADMAQKQLRAQRQAAYEARRAKKCTRYNNSSTMIVKPYGC